MLKAKLPLSRRNKYIKMIKTTIRDVTFAVVNYIYVDVNVSFKKVHLFVELGIIAS